MPFPFEPYTNRYPPLELVLYVNKPDSEYVFQSWLRSQRHAFPSALGPFLKIFNSFNKYNGIRIWYEIGMIIKKKQLQIFTSILNSNGSLIIIGNSQIIITYGKLLKIIFKIE